MGACVSSANIQETNTRIGNGASAANTNSAVEAGANDAAQLKGFSPNAGGSSSNGLTTGRADGGRGSDNGPSTSKEGGTFNSLPPVDANGEVIHPTTGAIAIDGVDDDMSFDPLVLEPGQMFTDQYRVLDILGHGDIGTTYAVESVNAVNCSIKMVGFSGREHLMDRVKEIQSKISRLQHDNVLSVYDVMENRDHATIVTITAFASRGNIFHFAGQLADDPDLLRKIASDVASGLRVLHSYHIYHGSIKLEDVLEIRPNVFAVADAGYWQLYDDCGLETLIAMERLALIAPEVLTVEDRTQLDKAKVDVWGFGILLYQLAFFLNPMRGSGTVEEVRQLMTTAAIPLPSNSFASADLLDVIQKCLEKDPRARPTIQGVLRLPYFRSCNSNGTSMYKMGGLGTVGRTRSFGSMGTMPKQSSGNAGHPDGFVVEAVIGKGIHGESFLVHLPSTHFTVAFKAMAMTFSHRIAKYKAEGDLPELRRQIAVGRRARLEPGSNVAGCLEFIDVNVSSVTQIYHGKGNVAMNYPSYDAIHIAIIMINDILKGLSVLHANNTYHCNLKPSNVFYGDEGTFVITDFGPILNIPQEILDHPEGCIYDVPKATLKLLAAGQTATSVVDRLAGLKAIDTFTVGLLAASVVPRLRNTVFDQLYRRHDVGLSVPRVLEAMREHSAAYPEGFMALVELALSGTATVEELLKCSVLKTELATPPVAPPIFEITERDLKNAIKTRFEFAEERRLGTVHGRANNNNSSVVAPSSTPGPASFADTFHRTTSYRSEQGGYNQSMGCNDEERIEYLYHDDLKCSICQAVMTYVVYFARTDCSVRCGKCVDVPPLLELEAMAVDIVHHFVDFIEGQSVAVLLPIQYVDDHVIDELEIKADLPTGQLRPKAPPLTNKEFSMARLKATKSNIFTRSVVAGTIVPPSEHEAVVNDLGKVFDPTNEPQASKPVLAEDWSADDVIANAVTNRSTELALFALGLSEVPSAIFAETFSTLISLDLSSNQLTDVPDLGRFTCLKTLRLSRNKLTELPPSIGDLCSLVFLDVAHNMLRSIPQEIMFCDMLEQIIADYNDFDAIPECIFDMPTIQSVLLAENKRIDSWPSLEVIEGSLMQRSELKITIDNKPSIYTAFLAFEKTVPKLVVSWNRIYPDYIAPNLYCGSLRSAQTLSVYEQLSIGYVLTMGRGLEPVIPEGMKHKTIIVDDIPNAKIDVSFDDAVAFIDESIRSGKGCLVHCFAGLSRSATAVIAYLMVKQGMRLDDAYMLTKKGRPNIYPNDGFLKQLMGLDETLFPGQRKLDLEQLKRGVIPT